MLNIGINNRLCKVIGDLCVGVCVYLYRNSQSSAVTKGMYVRPKYAVEVNKVVL